MRFHSILRRQLIGKNEEIMKPNKIKYTGLKMKMLVSGEKSICERTKIFLLVERGIKNKQLQQRLEDEITGKCYSYFVAISCLRSLVDVFNIWLKLIKYNLICQYWLFIYVNRDYLIIGNKYWKYKFCLSKYYCFTLSPLKTYTKESVFPAIIGYRFKTICFVL